MVFLRFVIFKKEISKKIAPGFFRICKYTFFNIWQRNKQKIASGFLGFVSIITFLVFEKGNKQKIAPSFLGFVSILFLIFKERNEQKIASRFVNMLFYIFEKGNKQKIAPGFLGFVSILFNFIIFSGKRCYRDVSGLCVWFYKYCCF